MTEMNQKLYEIGVIPVIKIEDPEDAIPLAKALIDGGLPAAEITFRTACAGEAIRRIHEAYPDMLIGAGTVLTPAQVDEAVAAGASFIVAPGLNPKVVSYCVEKGVPMLPGCSSPSDIEAAIELGLDTVKFFPAESAGGLPMLKAMSAPYGKMMFMPTGGISPDNMLSYLKFNKILCCGGSFMVKDEWIKEGNFAKITEQTKEAVSKMLGFEFAHIGINNANDAEAKQGAELLKMLFHLPTSERSKSYFAGEKFELMKLEGRGTKGHIGVSTNFVDRAIAYFKRMGVAFDEESLVCDDKGKAKFIYFRDEICGFAVHLVNK